MVDTFYDRVCETSTSTGTGNFTLDGAVPGFLSFDAAGVSNSTSSAYLIEAVDANGVPTGEWEAGIGQFPDAFTLVRGTITGSSSFGYAVDFPAGPKRVHMSANAAYLNYVGGVYTRSAALTGQNFTSPTALGWTTQFWHYNPANTGFFLDVVTNNSRITMPSGYDTSMVRLRGQVALENITAGDWAELKILRNGSGTPIGRSTHYIPNTASAIQIESRPLFVNAADYFELFLQIGADTTVDVKAYESWFEIEVLQ